MNMLQIQTAATPTQKASASSLRSLEDAERELRRLIYTVEDARKRAEAVGDRNEALRLQTELRRLSRARRKVSDMKRKYLLRPQQVRSVARRVSGAAARARAAVTGLSRFRRVLDRIAEVLGYVDRLLRLAA